MNVGINSQDIFSGTVINIGSTLSIENIKEKLVFDNLDGLATNLPDYIRQIIKLRIQWYNNILQNGFNTTIYDASYDN